MSVVLTKLPREGSLIRAERQEWGGAVATEFGFVNGEPWTDGVDGTCLPIYWPEDDANGCVFLGTGEDKITALVSTEVPAV